MEKPYNRFCIRRKHASRIFRNGFSLLATNLLTFINGPDPNYDNKISFNILLKELWNTMICAFAFEV